MRDSRGATFIELIAAMSIVGVALLIMTQQLTLSYRENNISVDKAFAYRKALGILSEAQAAVQRGSILEIHELDALADQEDNPTLTTMEKLGVPFPPDDPASDNRKVGGQWRWLRRIRIDPIEGSEFRRYVHVTIKQRQDDGRIINVASAGSILTLLSRPSPRVKEFDIYVLAMANAPSSWLPVPTLRPMLRSAAGEISTLNPGLQFRLHWITKFGYGRDPLYTPFVNRTQSAEAAAPWAYAYPGVSGSETLTEPELLSGRVRTEEGLFNVYDATDNPVPHTVADQFNHCVRAPVAREIFDARVAAGLENADEPPLQLLLDDMWREPTRFENAIFLNMHGEGLPFPPVRNYSDAAKSPTAHPGVRVVTHPAKIRPARDPDGDSNHGDTDDMDFFVYAYKTDPATGPTTLSVPITLQIFGFDLSQNVNGVSSAGQESLEIRRASGGINPTTGAISTSHDYDDWNDSNSVPPTLASASDPYEMSWEAGYSTTPSPHTWIRLHHTPLTAPPVDDEGLKPGGRLYGMEYIPSLMQEAGYDTHFHTDREDPEPCNTSRWRIRIPKEVFGKSFPGGGWTDADTRVDVVTRIGTDTTTGVAWPTSNDPYNRSRTHCWWASSPDAVPMTERYQFLGDPRHNPYSDLAKNGSTSPHGYNWFFDDFRHAGNNATGDWPEIDSSRIRDGAGLGVIYDTARMMQVWRGALQTTKAVLTNARGELAGSILLGGEFARNPEGTELGWAPVPVHGQLYGSSYGVTADTITASFEIPASTPGSGSSTIPRIGQTTVRDASNGFWAKPWLGELFPDSAYSTWMNDANLATGTGSGQFIREMWRSGMFSYLPEGTSFSHAKGAQLGNHGAASLFCADSSATLAHVPEVSGHIINVADIALDLIRATGVSESATVDGRLPFELNHTLSPALPESTFTTTYPKNGIQLLRSIATTATDLVGSGIIECSSTTDDPAFFTILGDTPGTTMDHADLTRRLLMSGLAGLYVAAEPAWTNAIQLQPLVSISSPAPDQKLSGPRSTLVTWRTPFVRFDGADYTPAFAAFEGDESQLVYRVLTSADGGDSWVYANSSLPATVGTRPPAAELVFDSRKGDESMTVDLPVAEFPGGSYLIRVECYHRSRETHFSHHQVRIWIER